jgi:hypothetical protein
VHDTAYREIFSDWINSWVRLLKSAIELGQTQGRFQNVRSEPAARAISAIYQGMATRWYLARDDHSTDWAIDSMRRSITGLLGTFEDTT